jgi:hypothetical protein
MRQQHGNGRLADATLLVGENECLHQKSSGAIDKG